MYLKGLYSPSTKFVYKKIESYLPYIKIILLFPCTEERSGILSKNIKLNNISISYQLNVVFHAVTEVISLQILYHNTDNNKF